MSVTELLKLPEVSARLIEVFPPLPKRISASLLAPPVTNHWALVGTAYDYALRFELERRFPHAQTDSWVAETSLAVLPTHTDHSQLIKKAESIVAEARAAALFYNEADRVKPEARRGMVEHAIRLAKVDAIYRAHYLDPAMDTVDPGDVEDVLRLLDVTPYDSLGHADALWLNPVFGDHSRIVGGADADAISGDRLVDFKVTKNDTIQPDYLKQLVSYVMLGRAAHRDDASFPEIRQVGIYFARHAHLWMVPAESFTAHPAFNALERWYFDFAEAVYGRQAKRLESAKRPASPAQRPTSKGPRKSKAGKTRRAPRKK